MPFILAHSATKLEAAAGKIVVCGSHAGAYVGHLALAAGVRAIVLNDAGFGRANAGVAGLAVCDAAGLPAVALAHTSCRIGDADDALARGIVSAVNAPARALSVAIGQTAVDAVRHLGEAPEPGQSPHRALASEHRETLTVGTQRLVLVDSNALVDAATDRGAIIVTGSHGGLVGGDPRSAGRAEALLFAFNDAGGGIDAAGTSRLPVLATRHIAGVCVGASTATIGDARSTLLDGMISAINAPAKRLGALEGVPLRTFVERLAGMMLPRLR